MKDQSSLTIRLDTSLLRSLKTQAVMNDRSANGEIVRILRNALPQNEKTTGADLGGHAPAVPQTHNQQGSGS